MRWSRDRGLPVHRVPGGKSGSVFAYVNELEAWTVSTLTAGDEEIDPRPEVDALDPPPSRLAGGLKMATVGIALAMVFILSGSAGYAIGRTNVGSSPIEASLPAVADRGIRRDFLLARDLWGRRTGDDIRQSIALYESIIARSPDFAPAHSGLAEAWLIYREYGATNEAEAYRKAKSAIDRALALNPDLPSAHRAKGFWAYWWAFDSITAEASFRRSIELDPNDATTRFWFANVLADLGRHDEAEREYDAARYLLPGFRPLEVEQACSLWQAGRDDEAVAALRALARRYPDDATIHNCLAWAAIGRGDIGEFVVRYARMAEIRQEPALSVQAESLSAAYARNPGTAHRALIAALRQEFAEGLRQTRLTPAFYASSMGDRTELLQLLNEAVLLDESWHSKTLVDRMQRRWQRDDEIASLLGKLVDQAGALSPSR